MDAASAAGSDAGADALPVAADAAVDVSAAVSDAAPDDSPAVTDADQDRAVVDAAPAEVWGLDAASDLAPVADGGGDGPVAIPSRQSVGFYVMTERSGWVVTEGWLCAPLVIERQVGPNQWETVTLGLPFQCGCECPSPGQAGPAQLGTLVTPNDLWVWDARELVVVETTVSCSMGTGTPNYSVTVLTSVARPVSAGHYRATMTFDNTLPAACQDPGKTGTATCTHPMSGTPPTTYSRCEGDLPARAEFDLPDSGDIVVDLLVG
jgi:hypothetical protein